MLSLRKCKFSPNGINYLGHVTRPGRLKVLKQTSDAMLGLRNSTKVTELRSCVGQGSLFRCLVPSLARLVTPLNKKIRKIPLQDFDGLSENEINVLETQNVKFVEPLVLALPHSLYDHTVDMNACDKKIGCFLLLKEEEGASGSVGYWSRLLNDPDRASGTAHCEILAVIWAVQLL